MGQIKQQILVCSDPSEMYRGYKALGYTNYEALRESIEDEKNHVSFYVRKFGVKILRKKDLQTTGKSLYEIAEDAGNFDAAETIKAILTAPRNQR
jgi:hypothetical protein